MENFDYKDMVKSAKNAGITSDAIMWSSIDNLGDMLDILRNEHSEMYWKFMRKQYGLLYNNHYGKEFADHDVSKLSYTDSSGAKHEGPHWTKEEINNATANMKFPNGTTPCDKYVAFNAAYADFCKHFTEEQILQIAYDFFFNDEDWGTNTKVWDYFCIRNK